MPEWKSDKTEETQVASHFQEDFMSGSSSNSKYHEQRLLWALRYAGTIADIAVRKDH